jgi:hypothetical protein
VGFKYTPRRISRLRFLVQLTCFGILLYGGFLISGIRDVMPGVEKTVTPGDPSPAKFRYVQQGSSLSRIYLPATVCVYQRQGLCRGCSLYYVSDTITWLTPFAEFLPYLLILLGVNQVMVSET